MSKKEIKEIALKFAEKEGWNPGLYDFESFYATDPNGFFVELLNGQPIACISAVAYDDKFGFMGLYIVAQKYRNKGYGLRLWNQALKHLPTQNIGLDGVVAQQENYKKSGFKLAYRNIRYEGISKKYDKQPEGIVLLKDVDFKELISFDTPIFPASRDEFLRYWIDLSESYAVGSMVGGKLNGYGVIRKCVVGYKIGPLFAENYEIADKILLELTNFLKPETKYYLDVPECNQMAMKLAENYQMTYVFETGRMYTKEEPIVRLRKVFGVTSLELG